MKLTYYTDGSCKGNPGPGGYGIVRLSKIDNQIVLSEYYSNSVANTTNNRMELEAVLRVLELSQNAPDYEYEIYSDSAYVVNICNDWIWKWAANGWVRNKNKQIENLDIIKKIYNILNFATITYNIKKCSGHSGILENEIADALAKGDKIKFNKIISENNIKFI